MTIGAIILNCATPHEPDVGMIDHIACLQLAARRRSLDLRLTNASRSLRELIALCGLAEVLRVESERKPE